MKLRTGRAAYRIPPHSQIISVYIMGNQPHNQMVDYVLVQVSLRDLADLSRNEHRKKVRATPTGFAVFDEKIVFWPTPDKPYKVVVRYTPPIAEF